MAERQGRLFARTTIGGVRIDALSRAELIEALLADHADGKRNVLVFDANGQALSLAARDPAYLADLRAADIVHADGGFLVTLSRWLGGARIPERSATTDMIHDLARACAPAGLSFYLLGGTVDVNARCVARFRRTHPELAVAGAEHGYFAETELEALVSRIAAARPTVLWVGIGKPREQAIARRLAERDVATWIVTCGGCFDFLAGDATRAPRWMQRLNLEWLYRLAREPRRLFWRYLTTNPHALWLALTRRGEC